MVADRETFEQFHDRKTLEKGRRWRNVRHTQFIQLENRLLAGANDGLFSNTERWVVAHPPTDKDEHAILFLPRTIARSRTEACVSATNYRPSPVHQTHPARYYAVTNNHIMVQCQTFVVIERFCSLTASNPVAQSRRS